MFDKELSESHNKKKPFTQDKLFYNQEQDCYICPIGQKTHYIGDSKRQTSTGFEQASKRYQAKNCATCPLNGACHKSQRNRIQHRASTTIFNQSVRKNNQRLISIFNKHEKIKVRKACAICNSKQAIAKPDLTDPASRSS